LSRSFIASAIREENLSKDYVSVGGGDFENDIYFWRYAMFKIFRKNCCGLDVHKTWIYACIGITDENGRAEYKQARFSSFSKGLGELAAWLAKV
jgi:hypothetical protein